VYFGPQGIAVNPCEIKPFQSVYNTTRYEIEDKTQARPEYTPNERWSELSRSYKGAACSIVGDGNSPPTLECGHDLVVTFAKDPRYGQTTDPEICEGTHRYYRYYSVDYTE
jgi:hypothetical protein